MFVGTGKQARKFDDEQTVSRHAGKSGIANVRNAGTGRT